MPESSAACASEYSILGKARQPFAVLLGLEMILCYANPSFCALVEKESHEILGHTLSDLSPKENSWPLLFEKLFQNGKPVPAALEVTVVSGSLVWPCEIWPIWNSPAAGERPSGLLLQVKDGTSMQHRATVMNEALLLSAVRQHELIEETERLNEKLTAEINRRQRVEFEIERLAFYDALTDLPNRRLLMDRLHHATLASHRTLQHGAVFFIDLDQFKSVNDNYGHHVGDLLLQHVARRLQDCLREEDTVARLGGDEFVVLVQDLSDSFEAATLQAKALGVKLLSALNRPYFLEDKEHECSGSIGIALFGKNKEPVDDLLKRADMAQYQAKTGGGDSIRFFAFEMQSQADARRTLEAELGHAVREGQFRLHYQAQVDQRGVLKGFEALLRWEHPDRGLLLPGEFIVYAEEHGIIEEIGQWVLTAACTQLVAWSNKPETSSLTLAINVSAREFSSPEFVSSVRTILATTQADATKLILEFTERIMFNLMDDTLEKMRELKACGLSFALDDFGVGFSSLTCLKGLPVSQLKIDQSFVQDVLTSHSDSVIASAIIDLGKNLGLTVIAEGVENESQRKFLAQRGCRLYQGYLFGRPQPIDKLNFS